MRTWIAAKIHRIVVTGAELDYVGSVSIDAALLDAAGISPWEQVHVVNLANGERWVTYAVPGGSGEFSLNGGGARLGVVGDRCVVMAYRTAERFEPARVVVIGEGNHDLAELTYGDPDAGGVGS